MSIELHVQEILRELGRDPNADDHVRETPHRVAAFLRAHFHAEPVKFTTFPATTDDMVVVHDIPFYSLCEHHLVPFFGTAVVGYLPGKYLAGLSKLARAVMFHASGATTQERMAHGVLGHVQDGAQVADVGVVLRARHLCMEMRGVKVHDTWTVTSALGGKFRADPQVRSEFLDLSRGEAR